MRLRSIDKTENWANGGYIGMINFHSKYLIDSSFFIFETRELTANQVWSHATSTVFNVVSRRVVVVVEVLVCMKHNDKCSIILFFLFISTLSQLYFQLSNFLEKKCFFPLKKKKRKVWKITTVELFLIDVKMKYLIKNKL